MEHIKDVNLLALYNDFENLVGYFHNDDEINEYISFLNKRGIKTKNWTTRKGNFIV